MPTSYRRRRRGGFTLIEVLLVMLILVILASLAVTAYVPIQRRANIHAAQIQIGLFKEQLGVYHVSMGTYPSTDQGLHALWNPPTDLPNPDKWDGPYSDSPIPLDPWDIEYRYEYPGRRNTHSFDVWSAGPNGIDGDVDDVGNWAQE
jgi:general secretion pathway protein G